MSAGKPLGTIKRIFIASPLRGDHERNIRLAKHLCMTATRAGFAPYAPHLFFTLFLDDSVAHERMAGIDGGCAWLRAAHELWAYADNFDACSEGMKGEIKLAQLVGVPVLYMPPTLATAKHTWELMEARGRS